MAVSGTSEVDSGLHSTVSGSMDMSVDNDNNDDNDDGILPDRGHHQHHPSPLRLPRDPSTDIPLDPDLAESHYLDVDDFEADESESEVCQYLLYISFVMKIIYTRAHHFCLSNYYTSMVTSAS